MENEDKILEHELLTNQRTVYHSQLGHVVIKRPTPAVEIKIGEERRRIYHQDLKNEDVLTTKEVERILEKRGIWNKDMSERMQELTTQSAQMISRLTAAGFDNVTTYYTEVLDTHEELLAKMGEEHLEAITRIFNMDSALDAKTLKTLTEEAESSTVLDLIEQAQELRRQGELLRDFNNIKNELAEITELHAHFFGDTIEARAQRAERMARVYYCVRKSDGSPLWDTLDDMWNSDPELVAWVSAQLYYFEYGITEEYARVLQNHGFMERVSDTGLSSDDSQDHPTSNSDGESPEPQQTDSSELEASTTS